MAAPSSAAVVLIVGMGVSTWGVILTAIWYFARRFLEQQKSNHGDTLEALDIARDIQRRLPKATKRIRALERGHQRHGKSIQEIAWLMDVRETAPVTPPAPTRPATARVRR